MKAQSHEIVGAVYEMYARQEELEEKYTRNNGLSEDEDEELNDLDLALSVFEQHLPETEDF